MGGRTKDTPNRTLIDRQDRFIAAYRNSCNIRAACEAADIPRSTVYDWFKNEDFQQRLKDAHEDALDILEAVGWQRAKKQSDRLIEYFLTAGRPHKYGRTLKIDWRNATDEQVKALARGGEAGVSPAGDLLGGGQPDELLLDDEPDALSE